MAQEYITPQEAAELIGVSVSFIRSQKHKGNLGFIQLGGRYTLNKQDVLNLRKVSTPQHANIETIE